MLLMVKGGERRTPFEKETERNQPTKGKKNSMYEQTRKSMKHRLAALMMTLAMVLSMTVCSFASNAQTYNEDITEIIATVSYIGQSYDVTVMAPANTTYIGVEATLYQKQLFGRKEISSFTGSVADCGFYKEKSAEIIKGKTYILEATARVCTGGVWDTLESTTTGQA